QSFRLSVFVLYRLVVGMMGCLGYSIRDRLLQMYPLLLAGRRIADRMSLTPDFRSARHPQRKTER
ncbi:MAG TPA: hypothetical protein VHS08_04390, partial [Candidatus Acidoferrales bacterium]|nr:hypothetical protein [Candidatus Acidoferrales bacterium]